MQVQGKLKEVLQPQSGVSQAGKEWKKLDFVVDTTVKLEYPEQICFTLFNDKCSKIEQFDVGDNIIVDFTIVSREYNGKYFHNINAWNVEFADSNTEETTPSGTPMSAFEPTQEEDSGLPF